jgi:hemolysin III
MRRSDRQENWNAATHAAGAILAVAGLIWIAVCLRTNLFAATSMAAIVYGTTLVLMYVMSALSHWFADDERLNRFRALDQGCIYLIIVGTYTPFSIRYWNDPFGNSLLATMWIIAMTGFVFKTCFEYRVNRISVFSYLFLGWMPVIGIPFHSVESGHSGGSIECLAWILAGGIVYSAGTVFLVNDRHSEWFHPIWHLFVIAGSVIHFVAVAKFVVLAA